jgi:hypothetical protein
MLLAVSVRTLDPAVGLALNNAVTPVGKPDTARFTLPEKPYCGFIVMVELPEVP